MRLLEATVMVCLFACSLATTFPCDHPLRHYPTFSNYFTHCECRRSEWTEWAITGTTNASVCPSGRAVIEERRQTVVSGDCEEIVERNATCEPSNGEKLILAFGLGSSGQRINTTGSRHRRSLTNNNFDTNLTINPFNVQPIRGKRSTCEKRQVCSGFGRRRRRVEPEIKSSHIQINTHSSNAELEPEPVNPIPFDMLKHGHRYRRCQDYDRECSKSQHILFVLDTSGSVPDSDFEMMINALGCLVPLFCNPIKVAVMTFAHNFYIEFGFDCYDSNTCQDRKNIAAAIGAITHRRGWRTLTGGAVRCVEELLTNQQLANFSIHEHTRCLDVVFITDGQSNGPLDACREMNESSLLSDGKIKVHSIGIGNVNKTEIACLTGNNRNGLEIFFPDFNNFTSALNLIEYDLKNSRASEGNDKFSCVNSDIYPVREENQPCIADTCSVI